MALVVVNLAPIVSFEYLPTSDGPSHVYNAVLIRDLWVGREWTERAREYVMFAPAVVPNWSGHLLIAAVSMIVDPAVAERCLLAGWVVLLPCALLYALRSVSRSADLLALCICPFAYSAQLHWGFYNFLTALVIFLLTVGYWLRHADHFHLRHGIVLAALGLLTYVSSLVAFVHVLIWIAVLAVVRVLARLPRARRTLAVSACGLAPGVFAWGLFWVSTHSGHITAFPHVRYAAANLLAMDLLNPFHMWSARVAAAALALTLWGTALFLIVRTVRKRHEEGAPLLLVAVICTAIVFVAPSAAGGGTLLTPRQVYFAVFAVLLWMATATARTSVFAPVSAMAATVTVLSVVLNWGLYKRYDDAMRLFLSAGEESSGGRILLSFPPERRFVDLSIPPPGSIVLSGSAAGYLAARRRLVWLDTYEWQTDHFPLRRRFPEDSNARMGPAADVVLAWGDGRPAASAIAAALRASDLDVVLRTRELPGVHGSPLIVASVIPVP